jgi:hypothetical protein
MKMNYKKKHVEIILPLDTTEITSAHHKFIHSGAPYRWAQES